MVEIWLEKCRNFGIEEVLINVHAHASMVRDFVTKNNHGVSVHVVEEKALLGSAGTLAENRSWLRADDLFWVFYADVLHSVDLSAMLHLHLARTPVATLGVYQVPDPTRCGIVEVGENGVIRSFTEKPTQPRSDLAFAGILIGTPAMMEVIPATRPADIGFHVLPQLVDHMVAHPISEYLLDIGTMENYHLAQENWPNA